MQDAMLSAEQKELIARMDRKLAERGGTLDHDFSDPEHRAYVKLIHSLCGLDEERYPGLHSMIDAAPPTAKAAADTDEEDGWETAFGIAEIGKLLDSQLAAANGYGTVVGGFRTCNLSLLVRDQNGNFIASGSNAGQYPLNTLAVDTDNGGAKPAVSGMTAQLTYFYQDNSGQTHSRTIQANAAGVLSDPTVIEPKRENGNTNSYNPNAICIGLGRPNDLTRCDYIYNEPTQNNPIGRIPLVGSVQFSQPIQTLSPGNNLLVDIFVIRTDNGGKTTRLDATDMQNVYENFYIDTTNDPTGRTLAWNLPMKANVNPPPNPEPAYNPVVFSNIPWSTEMESYLTVNITVTLQDGSTAVAIIQSSPDEDMDPLDGIAYIKPLEFVWHCLGEDTEVTLADGSSKNITAFASGDTVKADNGGSEQTVSVTHVAPHAGEILRIETDGGHSLTASSHHVVFTPQGNVHMHALKVGDTVTTLGGSATITAVHAIAADKANLWNLSLGEAPQRNDPTPEIGSFFANGILVGDARAERALRYQCANDIAYVKANVHPSLHKDVESTFLRRGLPIE